MKKIELSILVKKKLQTTMQDLISDYGNEAAKKVLKNMIDSIQVLQDFEKSGIRIAERFDIDTDYWYIYTNHNYFVYKIESERILVLQMFHEREDFTAQLFGVSGRTQESIDYWGE